MNPLVSIIITTYNSKKFLIQCITSALTQNTHYSYEVVLVDDGSSDGTTAILDSIKHPLFRYFINQHAGQGATKNFAIKRCQGEIIIILDSDDYLEPLAVEKVINYFHNHTSVYYAYSEHVGVNSKGKIIFKTNKADYLLKNITKYNEDLIFHCCYHGHLMTMRKNIFRKIGYFNENLYVGIDYEWILRFCDQYQAGYIPDYLYYYRKHDNGINILIDHNHRCIEEIIEIALARKGIISQVFYKGRDSVGYRIYEF